MAPTIPLKNFKRQEKGFYRKKGENDIILWFKSNEITANIKKEEKVSMFYNNFTCWSVYLNSEPNIDHFGKKMYIFSFNMTRFQRHWSIKMVVSYNSFIAVHHQNPRGLLFIKWVNITFITAKKSYEWNFSLSFESESVKIVWSLI